MASKRNFDETLVKKVPLKSVRSVVDPIVIARVE